VLEVTGFAMTFCALAMKTFWRTEMPEDWQWHCYRRIGKTYKSFCDRSERPRLNGQHKWRPPPIRRCYRCDVEEMKLFERMSGKELDSTLEESADWRNGEGK
jgi:hypothetical protein